MQRFYIDGDGEVAPDEVLSYVRGFHIVEVHDNYALVLLDDGRWYIYYSIRTVINETKRVTLREDNIEQQDLETLRHLVGQIFKVNQVSFMSSSPKESSVLGDSDLSTSR